MPKFKLSYEQIGLIRNSLKEKLEREKKDFFKFLCEYLGYPVIDTIEKLSEYQNEAKATATKKKNLLDAHIRFFELEHESELDKTKFSEELSKLKFERSDVNGALYLIDKFEKSINDINELISQFTPPPEKPRNSFWADMTDEEYMSYFNPHLV